MAQYIQLRHIDTFHCTLPKDPPPTPKRLLRPSSTEGLDEAPKTQAKAGATSSGTKSPSSSSPSSSGGKTTGAEPSNNSSSSKVPVSDDSSRLVDRADSRTAFVSNGESVKANGTVDGSRQLPLPVREGVGGDMSLTGSVEKSAFEFGGSGLQFKVQSERSLVVTLSKVQGCTSTDSSGRCLFFAAVSAMCWSKA